MLHIVAIAPIIYYESIFITEASLANITRQHDGGHSIFNHRRHQNNRYNHKSLETGQENMTKNQTINNQKTKDQIKDLIVVTVKKRKTRNHPTTNHFSPRTHRLSKKETTKLLIELENENKLSFTKPERPTPTSTKEYIFPRKPHGTGQQLPSH